MLENDSTEFDRRWKRGREIEHCSCMELIEPGSFGISHLLLGCYRSPLWVS